MIRSGSAVRRMGQPPGNWTPTRPPTTSFNAVINGGTAQVTTTNNNTARTLQIGQDSGSNGTVDGFTEGKGSHNKYFGALLLGAYRDGHLR